MTVLPKVWICYEGDFLTKVVTKARNRSRHNKEAVLLMSTVLGWLSTSVPTMGEADHFSLVGKREINCLETQAFEYAKETDDVLEHKLVRYVSRIWEDLDRSRWTIQHFSVDRPECERGYLGNL